MDEEEISIETCTECGAPVAAHHRYCQNCGAYLSDQSVAINIFNNTALRRVFIFYFIYLFICLLVKHTQWFETYDQLFWVELLLAGVTGFYAWQNRTAIKPLLQTRGIKLNMMLAIILIAAGTSLLISLTVREVNITFFNSEVSYYQGFRSYFLPIILMVYSIATLPAFFEELAFRGVLFNYCITFLDERLVVAVTAFLFAIMHLSLISMVWLIPFGFFIGFLRQRYHTLWYGIVFHFIFNLTACLVDLYREGIIFSS